MNMQVQGKIHEAFEEKQVTQTFRKREFVLELDGDLREHAEARGDRHHAVLDVASARRAAYPRPQRPPDLERVLLTSPVLLARLRQEERRREEEEATVPNKAAATGPWFFTPEEGVGAVADEARNRPEGEPAPKRTSTPSDASANASTARDRVGAEGRSTRGCVEII